MVAGTGNCNAGNRFEGWGGELSAVAGDFPFELFSHLLAFALGIANLSATLVDKGHAAVNRAQALARLGTNTLLLLLSGLLLLLLALLILPLGGVGLGGDQAWPFPRGLGGIDRAQLPGDILGLGLCRWAIAEVHTTVGVDPAVELTGTGIGSHHQAAE